MVTLIWINSMRLHRVALAGAITLAAATLYARAEGFARDARANLASVRTLELPREVARMVQASVGNDREERSLAIVRAAVQLSRPSAPAIVGAASRIAPDLAPKFGALAAELAPSLAAGIARAAAASAPAYAGEIAAAVVMQQPAQYAQVAYEVGHVAPGKDEQIVNALVAGFPNLKSFTSLESAERGSATMTQLVAATAQVDRAARELGMKTEEFLVAKLTPTQVTILREKVYSPSAARIGASGAVGAARAVKGEQFTPGGGTQGQQHRAQPVAVTPGEGRSYYRPNPRPPLQ